MLENGNRLVDDMLHVCFADLELLLREDFLHPARVEIDEVTRTAAEIGQVLDGQTQTARAGRAHHQPRPSAWKMFVRNFPGEFLVVHLVIVPADALLGHPGGAAGLKNVERAPFVFRRNPNFGLQVAQPFVLEVRELHHVGERADFLARIEVFPRPVEPERAAGFGRKMPLDHVAEVGI